MCWPLLQFNAVPHGDGPLTVPLLSSFGTFLNVGRGRSVHYWKIIGQTKWIWLPKKREKQNFQKNQRMNTWLLTPIKTQLQVSILIKSNFMNSFIFLHQSQSSKVPSIYHKSFRSFRFSSYACDRFAIIRFIIPGRIWINYCKKCDPRIKMKEKLWVFWMFVRWSTFRKIWT